MKHKRILCALLAAAQMLALAACGSEDSKDTNSVAQDSGVQDSVAETTTESTTAVTTTTAQTTEATEAPAETTTAPEESDDASAETPEEAVEMFQKALKTGDQKEVLRLSDYEVLFRYTELERFSENLDEDLENFYNPELAADHKAERAEFEAVINRTKKEWQEAAIESLDRKKMSEYNKMFKSVDLENGEAVPKADVEEITEIFDGLEDQLAEQREVLNLTDEQIKLLEEEYPGSYDAIEAYFDQLEAVVAMLPAYTEVYSFPSDYTNSDG